MRSRQAIPGTADPRPNVTGQSYLYANNLYAEHVSLLRRHSRRGSRLRSIGADGARFAQRRRAGPPSEQPRYVLRRSTDYGAAAHDDDWPLDQNRMAHHGRDPLLGRQRLAGVVLLVDAFPLAHEL